MTTADLGDRAATKTIRGWCIAANCPDCGEALIHVADGAPTGLCSRAIARCSVCRRPWMVQIIITNVTRQLGRPRKPGAA